ncbi:MAG TPA: CRISPR-associated endonuclease Cas1 [Propionicimonas sp.]
MADELADDLVPARMINEVLYCERLLFLEYAQGEFADNYYTVDGRHVHRRADVPGGRLPAPPAEKKNPASADASADDDTAPPPADERPYEARSLWLSSTALGITAKIDVVEGDAEGTVIPIEYKRGEVPEVPEGAYLPERAQVCAQAMLLRDHGYRCEVGALYFAASRRRVMIPIDDGLVAVTRRAAARARELAGRNELPPPLLDSPKCHGCSLAGICLPDETNLLRRPVAEVVPPAPVVEEEPDVLFGEVLPGPSLASEVRRLHPARDDRPPLYVQDQGARVGLDGECLKVVPRRGAAVEVKIMLTSQVCLYGNVQISTQALRELMIRGIPVVFFTTGGWFCGRALGHDSKNVELRLAQLRFASDPAVCLALARGLVASKVRNCRTLLRRNHDEADAGILDELERLARKAERAEQIESLLGLEGTAARAYFQAFAGMFKADELGAAPFDFDGRNRRPPRDPVNALLSFCYAVLAKDFAITLASVGLDPMVGFYHQVHFGRASLALDLMEEFRPLVADSVVLSVINTRVVEPGDFVHSAGGVALRPEARRKLLVAYERRMDQLVTHPVFGYRISYRRVIEVQARLLTRLLLGEIAEYPSFRTR